MLVFTVRRTCGITLAGITAFSGILGSPVPTDIELVLPTEPVPVGQYETPITNIWKWLGTSL
jgi:hypothetical protein